MADLFRARRMVEFADTDMAGIAHFSAFFRWMEAAEHELLRSLGLSVYSEIDGQTISFPRVNATCDYTAPARCEQLLDIDVTLGRIGTRSLSYEFAFFHDGTPLATGKTTCVSCQIEHGQPPESVLLPQKIAYALRPYLQADDSPSK